MSESNKSTVDCFFCSKSILLENSCSRSIEGKDRILCWRCFEKTLKPFFNLYEACYAGSPDTIYNAYDQLSVVVKQLSSDMLINADRHCACMLVDLVTRFNSAFSQGNAVSIEIQHAKIRFVFSKMYEVSEYQVSVKDNVVTIRLE